MVKSIEVLMENTPKDSQLIVMGSAFYEHGFLEGILVHFIKADAPDSPFGFGCFSVFMSDKPSVTVTAAVNKIRRFFLNKLAEKERDGYIEGWITGIELPKPSDAYLVKWEEMETEAAHG